MVALPTPALAATASIEMAAALWPALSSIRTASRMASSAWALRGRPGALRSWAVSDSALAVVMVSIVTDALNLDQGHALPLRQPLGRGGRRRAGRTLAGQPEPGHQRAEQADDHGTDRRVVHRGDERVVGVRDQLRAVRAGLLRDRVRAGDVLLGGLGRGSGQAVGPGAEVIPVRRGEHRTQRGHAEGAAE